MKNFRIILLFLLLVSQGVAAPQYAAIVIDATTGEVLEAANQDVSCPPASLTKMMTLYLVFEAIEKGTINFHKLFMVSKEAARQHPSKLGLKAGERVPLEVLVLGLITRSANDAAVVIAEGLGGSQAGFTKMMNKKARALGMHNTFFCNPSGMPHPHQLTTARDMATLGQALHRDFHRFYHLFKIPSFNFRGHIVRNHNRLLEKNTEVDGIKTGWTVKSGFNLAASAVREGRRLFVVVLGGHSRIARDQKVMELFNKHFSECALVPPSVKESNSIDDLIHDIVEKPRVTIGNKAPPRKVIVHQVRARHNAGVQVGPFLNRSQANLAARLAARKVARLGGKVMVKAVRAKRQPTRYVAKIKGLTLAQAKTACQDLRPYGKSCLPFLQLHHKPS